MRLSDVFSFVYFYRLLDLVVYLFKGFQRPESSTTNWSPVELASAEQSHRDLVRLVDLCLLRKTDELGQRVLPYGIRQLIKDFLIVTLDNDSIRTAVKLW